MAEINRETADEAKAKADAAQAAISQAHKDIGALVRMHRVLANLISAATDVVDDGVHDARGHISLDVDLTELRHLRNRANEIAEGIIGARLTALLTEHAEQARRAGEGQDHG